ncbi:MAG: SRPBCC domain-containing protein [Burkholderiales bacterium]|jgi:uncharacterized protein YndB with AHSA1/START domain|nr:SRPBCC domain-containing protein [Burkholderiales bacterium]
MRIEIRLPASANTVFDAWVVPEVMRQWLFVGPSNRILEVTSDQRLGGKFYIREENDGRQIDHYGEYLRLERPSDIEFALEVPLHFRGVSRLRVELRDLPGECALTLTQTGAAPANAEETWRGMLTGLQRVLLGKPAIGGNGA